MYHSQELVEETYAQEAYVEEPTIQKQEATSTHLGGELYEAAREHSAEVYGAESAEVTAENPEDIVAEEPTADEEVKPLKSSGPKAFGQRSNEIFKDEADTEQSA